MKKLLAAFMLLLTAAAAIAAPGTKPVPAVKKQDIPCEFTAPGRRNAFFKVVLPLAKGELFDLSNLQMVDQQNRDIPLHTRISSRWQDGSFKWLLLRGYITLPASGSCKVRIQYGSQVLRQLVRQVIQVESGTMWQFSTGAMEMLLPKKPAELPRDIRLDGKISGNFAWHKGIVPKEFANTVPVVTAQDGMTIISYRTPGKKEVLQCRIYRNTTRIEFSGSEELIGKIVFSGKYPPATCGSGRFDFRATREELLKEKNTPLYGKIPLGTLRSGSNIPQIAPQAVKYPWFKEYKALWYKRLDCGEGDFSEYCIAYFDSGDSRFLHQAAKKYDPAEQLPAEEKFYAYITGISGCAANPPATAAAMTEKEARQIITEQNENIPVWKYAEALKTLRRRDTTLFQSGVKLLLYSLNRDALRWHSSCSRFGDGYGPLLPAKFNLTAAELLLAGANSSGDRSLYLTACAVLQRTMIDGHYCELLCRMPGLFLELEQYYRKHPGEKVFAWSRDGFFKAVFGKKKTEFNVAFFGKRFWHLRPHSGSGYFMLELSRTEVADSSGLCRVHIFSDSGKELKMMPLPKTNTSVMLTLPANTAKVVIEDDQSGSWNLSSAGAEVMLEADNRWLQLPDPALKNFSFELPAKSAPPVMRFSGLTSDTLVEVISPDGKIHRPEKNAIRLPVQVPGKYQLRIHSPHAVQFAFDRIKVNLSTR